MALKFYSSVEIISTLKHRTFWGLTPAFVEVTAEKLVGSLFDPPPSWIKLKTVAFWHNFDSVLPFLSSPLGPLLDGLLTYKIRWKTKLISIN